MPKEIIRVPTFLIFLLFLANSSIVFSRPEQDRTLINRSSKFTEVFHTNNLRSLISGNNSSAKTEDLTDKKHGVKMGIPSDKCDNAKDNLDQDWGGSPVNYTCYTKKYPIPVQKDIESVITCDSLPDIQNYSPPHFCMNQSIHYVSHIPTHEGHRPLWPVYGEYTFLPPQRWLHNIEHGAIVLLFHPCAARSEVAKLKKLVKSCLWKYIISPWNMLSREMPFALVAWTCRLQMASVDPGVVKYFIRAKAFRGPEAHYSKQGQYSFGLIEASEPPTNSDLDKVLC